MKRIGSLATFAAVGLAASVFAVSTTFDTYSIDQGLAAGGGQQEMVAADGKSAIFTPGATRSVSITFDGTAPMDQPNADQAAPFTHGTFTIYSHVVGRTLMSVELYNYLNQRWEQVYVKRVGPMEARGYQIPFKMAENYICPMGKERIKARVNWVGGNFKSVAVDFVEWDFTSQP